MRFVACLVALSAALAVGGPAAAQGKGKKVVPDKEWVDVINDEKLAKEAPKDGIVVDAKSFEKVWKAWRKDEKVPEVDFAKKLVVVTTSVGGPNRPRTSAVLTEAGDLKVTAFSTLIGGDAFGYAITLYPSEGVKKVNGKDLPKK